MVICNRFSFSSNLDCSSYSLLMKWLLIGNKEIVRKFAKCENWIYTTTDCVPSFCYYGALCLLMQMLWKRNCESRGYTPPCYPSCGFSGLYKSPGLQLIRFYAFSNPFLLNWFHYVLLYKIFLEFCKDICSITSFLLWSKVFRCSPVDKVSLGCTWRNVKPPQTSSTAPPNTSFHLWIF